MERTFTARTEVEAILLEQALLMARELEAVSDAAPDGQVLAVAEAAAVRSGREPTRAALEAALRRQAEAAEKKGAPAGPAPAAAAAPSRTGGQDDRDRGRAGDLRRQSLRCPELAGRRPTRPTPAPAPAASSAPRRPGWPAWPRRAGPSTSPPTAWTSWPASGSTTRRSAAPAIRRPPPPRPAARRTRRRAAFAAARGQVEFLADGVMAPTRGGWRELKLALYLVRPAGAAAAPEEWATRELPRPTAAGSVERGPGRQRGVLGPLGPPRRGPGERPVRAADGPGRRRRVDLGRRGGAVPGRRAGPGYLPRLAAPGRGRRGPARRGDGRGRRVGRRRAARPAGRRLAGAARPHRGDVGRGPDGGRAGGRRRAAGLLRQAHRSAGLLRAAPLGPRDRQRRDRGPGAADGPPAEGAGAGLVRREPGRDGGADRHGRHPGMGRPLVPTRRLNSGIESYTRSV